MRIRIVDENQQTPEESQQIAPSPEIVSDNESRIRIYREDDLHQELQNIQTENVRLQNELNREQESARQAAERITQLERELELKEEQLLQAMRQAGADEEITADDLEDKDSIIEELRAKNSQLEELLRQGDGSNIGEERLSELMHELEMQKQENEDLQDALTDFMEQKNVVQLPQMITYRTPTPQQAEAIRKYTCFVQMLQTGEGDVVTLERLEEMNWEIEQHKNQAELLKRQLKEAEQEEGQAFEKLQEINLRYQQDMKYVEFYEKVPEKKIDGLELFRSQVKRLDTKLSEILDTGLRKSYIFRGSTLLAELEKNKNETTRIMEELRSLVENYEFDGRVVSDEVKSTEEYLREAKACLEELEKTLRNMHTLSEKFLRIKNIIGFDYEIY